MSRLRDVVRFWDWESCAMVILLLVCWVAAVVMITVIGRGVDHKPRIITSETVRAYYDQRVLGSMTVVDADYFEWTMATATIRIACVRGDTIAFLKQN